MQHIALLQKLIRCKSITPMDDGAIPLLMQVLNGLGFQCTLLEFSEPGYHTIKNLYAKLGSGPYNFCFAGHTDVVPVGNIADWKYDPFAAVIENNIIYGRGVVDMKAAIIAFIAAIMRMQISSTLLYDRMSISLMITGDEEDIAINGTPKIIRWLQKNGEQIDACIVGEPTSREVVGDIIKIGARGSMNMELIVYGVQGHVAYHEDAVNPIPILASIIQELEGHTFDNGNELFQPSNLEFTGIAGGNQATNIIPAHAHTKFNIRFNNLHSAHSVYKQVESICRRYTQNFALTYCSDSDAFITQHAQFSSLAMSAIEQVSRVTPTFTTAGATSDARFIQKICTSVIELGLLTNTAHQVDEHAHITDIEALSVIYEHIICNAYQLAADKITTCV